MWHEKIFDNRAHALAFKRQLDVVCCDVETDFYIGESGYCVRWRKLGLVID